MFFKIYFDFSIINSNNERKIVSAFAIVNAEIPLVFY